MQAEIYADIVFAVNLAMDFALMSAAGAVLRVRRPWWRRLLGAATAALAYCLIAFTLPYSAWLQIVAAVAVLMLGLAVAFCPAPPILLGKIALTMFLLAFGAGGVMLAIGQFGGQALVSHTSVWVLIGGTAVSYVLLRCVRRYLRAAELKKQACYTVTVALNGTQVSFMGLVDTGNSLVDPITHAPVMVAELAAIQKCLPEPILRLFLESREHDLPAVLESFQAGGLSTRMRMIPFASVGQANGLLVGLRADSITVALDKESKILPNAIIGICREPLGDSAYGALLNPEMIT